MVELWWGGGTVVVGVVRKAWVHHIKKNLLAMFLNLTVFRNVTGLRHSQNFELLDISSHSANVTCKINNGLLK